MSVLCLAGLVGSSAAGTVVPESSSDGKTPWFTSYEEGMRFAKANDRPVLIKFSAVWCGWCKKLDEEVLVQPPIVHELKKFVCIKVDVDKNPQVALAYAARSLPRMLVVNTHDEIVGDWLGYRPADSFLSLIQDIQAYTRTEMGTLAIPKGIPSADRSGPPAGPGANGSVETLSLEDQLGHREPAIRQQAMDRLLSQGPEATPTLIDLLEHPYLGVRIAAWKCLAKRQGTELTFDPWASRAERTASIGQFRDALAAGPPSLPRR